ncbi:3-phosphoshikimate 1-carboxyvinyltransferase [Algiphilus sp.]|uniref:3-phosphoshikimate 1-carboxyvinyltransferase n=1 Tax=Algiphilus sp. TaxID=1872431 RepID=UPI0032EC4A55
MDYLCQPARTLRGCLRVPGDKSISHRAVMLAAIADGSSHIRGFLPGEDCLATLRAFTGMGVEAERLSDTELRIHGVGRYGLKPPAGPIDLGNSGTSMRLLAGLLCAQPFAITLTGDASLTRRPMRRVTEPLGQMGARITTSETGTAPLTLQPADAGLRAIRYHSPVASAQIKSAVLLAGLYAEGRTELVEPEASRDHSERMLRAFGVELEAHAGFAALEGGQELRAVDIDVPSDISSAAFFLVGAAVTPGSELTLQNVGLNPTRTGIIDILRTLKADIEIANERTVGGEPVGDIRVRGGELKAATISGSVVGRAIDEMPAVFVAAACATGETIIRDAAELRVKESDRIQSMVDALRALGISAVPEADGARILGGRMHGGVVDACDDHRVAMSMAIASLRAEQPIRIRHCDNVQTSFPGFVEMANAVGLELRVLNERPEVA